MKETTMQREELERAKKQTIATSVGKWCDCSALKYYQGDKWWWRIKQAMDFFSHLFLKSLFYLHVFHRTGGYLFYLLASQKSLQFFFEWERNRDTETKRLFCFFTIKLLNQIYLFLDKSIFFYTTSKVSNITHYDI